MTGTTNERPGKPKCGLGQQVEKWVNRTGDFFGWVVFAMMLLVAFNVAMRYIVGRPLVWGEDVAAFLLVAIIFGSLGYTALHGGHIRVDVLIVKLSPRKQKVVRLVVDVLSLGVLVVFTWQAYSYVLGSFLNDRVIRALYEYPAYLPQAMIPLGLTLFCLVVAYQVYELAKELLGR